MPKNKPKEKRERLLTIKEMAALLNVDDRTIVEWIQYRRIPFVRVDGEFIRFRISDIAQWIKDRQQQKPQARRSLR